MRSASAFGASRERLKQRQWQKADVVRAKKTIPRSVDADSIPKSNNAKGTKADEGQLSRSAIEPGDAECIGCPAAVAKSSILHARNHFGGWGEALDGSWKVSVRAVIARNQLANPRKNGLEIHVVDPAERSLRFAKLQNPAFTPRAKHPTNFAQSSIVVGKISKTERRRNQIKALIRKRKLKCISLDPFHRLRSIGLFRCQHEHGVRKVCAGDFGPFTLLSQRESHISRTAAEIKNFCSRSIQNVGESSCRPAP